MSQTEPPARLPPGTPSGSGPLQRDPADGALSPDEIFHLLQTNRRRDAIRYLHGRDGPVRMRDLAEQVAAWENDTTVRALSSRQRQRVYIPLYQTHLPKLDDAGVIEYDQSRGVVEPTDRIHQLYPYIEDAETDGAGHGPPANHGEPAEADSRRTEEDHDWIRYYTGASGLGVGVLAGSLLGVPPLATLSGTLIGTFIAVMFGLLTMARLVSDEFRALAR